MIRAQETTALVGPTGTGKSTIAKLIARCYDPDEGQVLLDGQDLRCLGLASLRGSVAILTQEEFLFDGTVHQNISLSLPEVSRGDVVAAAKAVGVHSFVARLPLGYDTLIVGRGLTLSAGQRQLISLARAWLIRPRVLILDEVTSSLDGENERVYLQGLYQSSNRQTTVIISHRASVIETCDRVIVVDGGSVIADGRPVDLLKGRTLRQLCGLPQL